ncbi:MULTISPECIES: hypothetical protein [unclassified Pseudoclavibacter]|uniref:hypothetical protein n=1 Tax=unclassified Pseudoclavibacter TaxID=2615177 RepID=UPI001BADE716|nr:hypothetical protein [Pseudoclavibacter sp. Marseille-Q4354]MBS3177920.1 hypothetical protein [Pseudoclavibacter sp. Marseille-Q4354]
MSSTGSSAGANTGEPRGGRVRDSANSGARVQAVHTGLKKVVTGRESVIKEQAVKLAEKLDVKTDGRHHQKIRLALLALNSLVDTLGRDGTSASEKKSSARDEGTDPAGNSKRPTTTSASSDEPEDIGTFTAKGNRPAK